jgi:hypothetical protein
MPKRLTRRERGRREREAEVKDAKTSPLNSTPPSYLRRNGLPLGFVLSGIGFFQSPYFWLGVVLFLVGALLLALDVWREVVVPKKTTINKSIFWIICPLSFLVFAIWLYFPVEFSLSVSSSVPRYGTGSNLYGIPWFDDYARLNLTMKNSGDVAYDDFDAEIFTDLTFEGVKQIDGIGSCAIAPASPRIRPTSQRMNGVLPIGPNAAVGGVPDRPVETDPPEYTIVAVGEDGKELAFSGDTAKKYRIRCDKFPAHSQITFVAALSAMNPVVNGRPPQPLHGPARPARWCGLKANFNRLGRPRSITFPQCEAGRECSR